VFVLYPCVDIITSDLKKKKLFHWVLKQSLLHPDFSTETVSGAAVVSVSVCAAAAAVSVQPGEGAAEPTA